MVYVIDSSDRRRLEESAQELGELLAEDKLGGLESQKEKPNGDHRFWCIFPFTKQVFFGGWLGLGGFCVVFAWFGWFWSSFLSDLGSF